MSRNIANKSSANSTKKPYCKVCFDSGKSESEYTSHWLRTLPDRDGKTTVTCPTLLSTECKYCYKLGHTAKFCSVLEKNKKNKEQVLMVKPEKPKLIKTTCKDNSSMFDALRDDDSDSEDEVVDKFEIKNDYKESLKIEPEMKTGWAAIAAKPKEDKIARETENKTMVKLQPQYVIIGKNEALKPAPWAKDYSSKLYTKSWADWTDSDTEEDEPAPCVQEDNSAW